MTITNNPLEQHVTVDTDTDHLTTIQTHGDDTELLTHLIQAIQHLYPVKDSSKKKIITTIRLLTYRHRNQSTPQKNKI
jgi:hypothetical protein